jgi:hypothetical protein
MKISDRNGFIGSLMKGKLQETGRRTQVLSLDLYLTQGENGRPQECGSRCLFDGGRVNEALASLEAGDNASKYVPV